MQVLLSCGQEQQWQNVFRNGKKAVDYILDNRGYFNEKNVFFEFIGGEPFLEIDMIDDLCDYIKTQMYIKQHPWFDNYMFEFTTNGINYRSEKVQQFIRKNHKHTEIAITIDGTRKSMTPTVSTRIPKEGHTMML